MIRENNSYAFFGFFFFQFAKSIQNTRVHIRDSIDTYRGFWKMFADNRQFLYSFQCYTLFKNDNCRINTTNEKGCSIANRISLTFDFNERLIIKKLTRSPTEVLFHY